VEQDESEAGRSERRQRSNVVPLPRDWLGPRDELVPFGPAARRSQREPATPPPSGEEGGLGRPTRAEDFWGESSGEMHDALEAPVPAPVAAPPHEERRKSPASGIAGSQRGRRTALGLVAATMVATGILAVLVTRLVTHGGEPLHASRTHSANELGLLRGRRLTIAGNPFGVRSGARRGAAHRVTPRPSPARRSSTTRRSVRPPKPTSAASPVSRSAPVVPVVASVASGSGTAVAEAPTQVATGRVETQSTSPVTSTGSGQSVSNESSQSSVAAPSSSSTASHSPAPAFGATGALGPGSSPNG
jgi:hypothetical protein